MRRPLSVWYGRDGSRGVGNSRNRNCSFTRSRGGRGELPLTRSSWSRGVSSAEKDRSRRIVATEVSPDTLMVWRRDLSTTSGRWQCDQRALAGSIASSCEPELVSRVTVIIATPARITPAASSVRVVTTSWPIAQPSSTATTGFT